MFLFLIDCLIYIYDELQNKSEIRNVNSEVQVDEKYKNKNNCKFACDKHKIWLYKLYLAVENSTQHQKMPLVLWKLKLNG